MVGICRTLVASPRFDGVILIVIVLNALVLGAQTYDGIEASYGDVLEALKTSRWGSSWSSSSFA